MELGCLAAAGPGRSAEESGRSVAEVGRSATEIGRSPAESGRSATARRPPLGSEEPRKGGRWGEGEAR